VAGGRNGRDSEPDIISSHAQGKKPYGQPDPLYAGMEGGAPGGIAPLGGHQFGGYESYGFDDDNFGSGALYPGGGMGMRSKKADMERECEYCLC